jgi:hypothetical protein
MKLIIRLFLLLIYTALSMYGLSLIFNTNIAIEGITWFVLLLANCGFIGFTAFWLVNDFIKKLED